MLTTSTRKPAVSGRFYPAGRMDLTETITEIYLLEKEKIRYSLARENIFGAVVPHAGYMFSAYQAVHFFALLQEKKEKTDTFIIINPNHTGYGEKIALDNNKYWNTPFGDIEQDEEFIKQLDLAFSNIAHENEHSGEVMLPLLQFFIKYKFKIVPITLSQQNTENAKMLANKINDTAKILNRKVMLIASSDFTHFKKSETGKELDDLVLKEIENQDINMVEQTVKQNNISVCGYGPIMCLMEYSSLQAKYHTEILARGHSGQIMPSDRVVNYITILFFSKLDK